MKEVKLGKIIGENQTVKFVAELGVNHLGDFERAKEMIDSAINSGADYLKFKLI